MQQPTITFKPNTDFDVSASSPGDLPSIHVTVSDGVNTVEQDVTGPTMVGYLADASAFASQIVRPAFKQCRMATDLAAAFVALQSTTIDSDTVESEVLAAKIAKLGN